MEKLLYLPGIALPAVLSVSFENTLQTGQVVLGVLLSIATIAGVVYGVRYRTAYEVESKVAEGHAHLADMKDKESKELHKQLLATKDILAKQAETIARLEQLPNLEKILQYMGEMAVRQDAQAEHRVNEALKQINEQWGMHEAAAEKRAEKIIKAIKEGGQSGQS